MFDWEAGISITIAVLTLCVTAGISIRKCGVRRRSKLSASVYRVVGADAHTDVRFISPIHVL